MPNIDPSSQLKSTLYYIDLVTLIIFTAEAGAKIISYGLFFNGEHSYLKNGWYAVDFTILVFTYLCLTPLFSKLKVVKALKFIKSIRLIGKNERLKVALKALVFAIPNVLKFTLMMLLFFLIFAVICVSYFKGKLYYCTKIISSMATGYPLANKWDCLSHGGLWLNRTFNFDSIPNAMITLFIMATSAGWGEQMINTITSSNEVDYVQNDERSTIWVLFFMTFMIVGSFIFLNLFVGVVISTFNREKDAAGGSELLTENQKEWIDLKLLVLRSAPIRKVRIPDDKFRALCYKI